MKDTIRLTKRNKDRLSFYNDDGNKAVSIVLDSLDSEIMRNQTIESFKQTLSQAPIDKSAGTFSSVSQSGSCTGFMPASSYTVGNQTAVAHATGMAEVLQREYWTQFDEHLDKAFEKARGY